MIGHWAWVLLLVIFAGGVAVGGLCVSLAGSRREDRAYDEGRADERADRSDDERDQARDIRGLEQALRDEGAGVRGLQGSSRRVYPAVPEEAGDYYPDADPGVDSGAMRAGSGLAGMSGQPEWEPEPGDRVYQWAHPHPIRATAPLTVIDWDALPWEERQLLTVWDWGRRMQAWVEDWDRDRLEAA